VPARPVGIELDDFRFHVQLPLTMGLSTSAIYIVLVGACVKRISMNAIST
jgi:hypothetical protein